MRIIKPYGRSHAMDGGSGANRRVLRPRPLFQDCLDVGDFAASHDELVIAQWISTIDKIATKPWGDRKPTERQRKFRDRLGKAAWAHLQADGLLRGLNESNQVKYQTLWAMKIAPYGEESAKPRRNKKGEEVPSPKGKWYARFAGDVDVDKVDGAAVAAKIHEHLYDAEYRVCPDVPNRKQGRIPARARSISRNVLAPRTPAAAGAGDPAGWSGADEEAYKRAGDVASAIRENARNRKKATMDIAGKALYDHYGKLFPGGDNGAPLSIAAAKVDFPGLFNLHMAVKDCYARILKHHRKQKVADLLPESMNALFALVKKQTANRDLNALVRLGKVIHYEATGDDPDQRRDVVDHWPADIAASRYWTSDGQAEIKRNEAFVRVWRHVIALAARTLTDWADPEGKIDGDVLGRIPQATGKKVFDAGRTRRKLDLLFGSRSIFFKCSGNGEFEKKVLKLTLEGTGNLRNASFHFKGLGGFAAALDAEHLPVDADVGEAIGELWAADVTDRAERLRETMRAAHFGDYFNEDQNRRLFAAYSDPGNADLPLPRFNRFLRRATDTWKGKYRLGLPQPANRTELKEYPARQCQYTALKLLYERPFKTWLIERDSVTLNAFIGRAVARTSQAAGTINAKDDKDRREVIVAKAKYLSQLCPGEDIKRFFFDLSAATASEMRVQRGYQSDADSARKQAEYIENLKCDVLALAFADYLKEAGFEFVRELQEEMAEPNDVPFDLGALDLPDPDTSAEDWQRFLYFLIHLVPVDEIGKLLHQMRKWEILAKNGQVDDGACGRRADPMMKRAQRVQVVLELYLEMHDAKFVGDHALTGVDDFKGLFDSEESFSKIFPKRVDDDTEDRRIPRRGLREIMRYGHLPALRSIFDDHRITSAKVDEFKRAEEKAPDGGSAIAAHQERREWLHEKWSRRRKEFTADDRENYVEALKEVVGHRHLAAQVTLTNHVRLHRLMMAVLGRLVDFSGLWERDLYFVTLALIHQSGRRPADVFTGDGIEKLRNGQIVDAVDKVREAGSEPDLMDQVGAHFGPVEKRKPPVSLRNDFAHFNMLRPKTAQKKSETSREQSGTPPRVDLSACVNQARRLMAYDRKLKNAVSQSIMELLHREGLELRWSMDPGPPHRLENAVLFTRQATHLGETKLVEKASSRPRPITEDLHGAAFVGMVATLFGGRAKRKDSVADVDLKNVEWRSKQSGRKRGSGENGDQTPKDGKRNPRNRRRNRQNAS